MKKRISRKLIAIIFMAVIMIFIMSVNSKAAEASISCQASVNVNETISISVSGSGVQWNLKLLVDGVVIATNSEFENYEANKPINFSGSYKPTSTGIKNVQLDGSITEVSDGSTITTFTPKSINVVAKEPNNGESSEPNNPPSSNSNNNNNNATPQKSSNANLKNLGIRPNDFTGFKPGTTTYNVTVPNNVEKVELYATKQDTKATLTGTGTKTLKEGTNALSVTVTAEDGTKKTYTVNVTRQAATESEDPEEPRPEENTTEENETKEEENNQENTEQEKTEGLTELKIEEVNLSPDFKTGIYEYTAKYIGEATSLNITAKANDESYSVEIIGNKDLVEGENLLTVLVSDSEGKNVATYQITVNKSIVDEEALAREAAEKQEEKKKQIILGGAIAALIVIILIIVVIVRSKKKNRWGDDYTIPYSGLNNDYDEYNNLDTNFDTDNNVNDNYYDVEDKQNFDEDIADIQKKEKHKGKRFK